MIFCPLKYHYHTDLKDSVEFIKSEQLLLRKLNHMLSEVLLR